MCVCVWQLNHSNAQLHESWSTAVHAASQLICMEFGCWLDSALPELATPESCAHPPPSVLLNAGFGACVICCMPLAVTRRLRTSQRTQVSVQCLHSGVWQRPVRASGMRFTTSVWRPMSEAGTGCLQAAHGAQTPAAPLSASQHTCLRFVLRVRRHCSQSDSRPHFQLCRTMS